MSLRACNITRAKVFKRDRYARRPAGAFHERRVLSQRADDSGTWTAPHSWICSWTYPESLLLAMPMADIFSCESISVCARNSRQNVWFPDHGWRPFAIIRMPQLFYAQNIVSNQANLLGLGLNVKYLSGAGVCACFASYKTLKTRSSKMNVAPWLR